MEANAPTSAASTTAKLPVAILDLIFDRVLADMRSSRDSTAVRALMHTSLAARKRMTQGLEPVDLALAKSTYGGRGWEDFYDPFIASAIASVPQIFGAPQGELEALLMKWQERITSQGFASPNVLRFGVRYAKPLSHSGCDHDACFMSGYESSIDNKPGQGVTFAEASNAMKELFNNAGVVLQALRPYQRALDCTWRAPYIGCTVLVHMKLGETDPDGYLNFTWYLRSWDILAKTAAASSIA